MGLFLVFGGAGHYGALILGWKRQREFVDRYIRQARRAAWGDELGVRGLDAIGGATAPAPAPAPTSGGEDQGAVAMNRRQKRMMDKENKKESRKGPKSTPRTSGTSTPTEQQQQPATSTGERKRVVAENGKVLIVDSIGNVFLEEESEEGEKQEFLLDIDEIHRPAITDTLVFKLPVWCFNKTVGRITGSAAIEEEEVEEIDSPIEEAETTATSTRSTRKRGKRSQRS